MRRVAAPVCAGLLVLAGCGAQATSASGEGSPAAEPTTLTVFAAASLKGTFTELGRQFEADHPGITVAFSFAGSSDLVTQIQGGAPADVFASADTTNMDKLTADGLVTAGTPEGFATNTLTIAVPPANPARIASLVDLTKPGVQLVTCAPEVPCGAAAARVEQAAGLDLQPVSEESSVTDVLNRVAAGEADAGLVYLTDVRSSAGTVAAVDFPEAADAVNTYPIAILRDSGRPELAEQFVRLVTSTAGQQVLADAGFGQP